jgi:hypothetical protein
VHYKCTTKANWQCQLNVVSAQMHY